jgi:hypothetical protein
MGLQSRFQLAPGSSLAIYTNLQDPIPTFSCSHNVEVKHSRLGPHLCQLKRAVHHTHTGPATRRVKRTAETLSNGAHREGASLGAGYESGGVLRFLGRRTHRTASQCSAHASKQEQVAVL